MWPWKNRAEERLKKLVLSITTQLGGRARVFIDKGFSVAHDLRKIQAQLDNLRIIVENEGITVDNTRYVRRRGLLGFLWDAVHGEKERGTYPLHRKLLDDLLNFYEQASVVVQKTTEALNRLNAAMKVFRDDVVTPSLIVIDAPIEVILSLLRGSAKRLEGAKKEMERLERE